MLRNAVVQSLFVHQRQMLILCSLMCLTCLFWRGAEIQFHLGVSHRNNHKTATMCQFTQSESYRCYSFQGDTLCCSHFVLRLTLRLHTQIAFACGEEQSVCMQGHVDGVRGPTPSAGFISLLSGGHHRSCVVGSPSTSGGCCGTSLCGQRPRCRSSCCARAVILCVLSAGPFKKGFWTRCGSYDFAAVTTNRGPRAMTTNNDHILLRVCHAICRCSANPSSPSYSSSSTHCCGGCVRM